MREPPIRLHRFWMAALLWAALTAWGASAQPVRGASAQVAAPWRLVLDPAATRVRFELGATLHTVRGSFALREGDVRFDPRTGGIAGEVVIDAKSGETGNATRDRNMHAWVLESERHPEIVLRPGRLEISERSEDGLRGVLHAEVAIHGGVHEVAIPVEARRNAPGRGRVAGSFEVPFVAWGMDDPSNFLLRVEKVISVRFEAEGALSGP